MDLTRIGAVRQVAGHTAFGIAGEIEVKVEWGAKLQVTEVRTGAAHSLHGAENGHHSGPLHTHRSTTGTANTTAPATCAEIGFLLAPFAGQSTHITRGYAGFSFLPLGCLGYAVVFTEDVGFPFSEAGGALFYKFFVVRAFRNPSVCGSFQMRRIG